MSRVEVFSYALLLKGAERTTQIIELLDEGKQEEVKAVLEPFKGMLPAAIRQLWCERRKADGLSTAAGI